MKEGRGKEEVKQQQEEEERKTWFLPTAKRVVGLGLWKVEESRFCNLEVEENECRMVTIYTTHGQGLRG